MKYVVFLLTLCFAINFADKEVRIVAINKVNSGRTTPPYDLDITVKDLDDDANLLAVMEKAKKEGKMT